MTNEPTPYDPPQIEEIEGDSELIAATPGVSA